MKLWHGVLLLLFLLFAGGMVWLLSLQFARGNVFPPGSTLRSDPLGAKALYETFERLPAYRIERNFLPWGEVELSPDSALFALSLPREDLAAFFELEDPQLMGDVARGAHLVGVLEPGQGDEAETANEEESELDSEAEEDRDAKPEKGRDKREKQTSLEERLLPFGEFWTGYDTLLGLPIEGDFREAGPAVRADVEKFSGLPETISWQSTRGFGEAPKAWEVVYRRGDTPVVVRRAYGEGQITLVAGNYLVRNEALLKQREGSFLVWLAGEQSRLIFDEAHLGTVRQTGVATLLREYGFLTLLAGLAIPGALFVWRSLVPVVPERSRQREETAIVRAARGSETGLTELVRRFVTPAQLMDRCLAEWHKSLPRHVLNRPRITATERILRDPNLPESPEARVKAYQAAAATLHEKKKPV